MTFNFRDYYDLSQDIAAGLQLIGPCDIVVGIPKSGLIPATIIASFLSKPFYDLDSFEFSFSKRSGVRKLNASSSQRLNVLIVDDSVNTGAEFKRVKTRLAELSKDMSFSYCAVYGRANGAHKDVADVVLAHIPQPRVFQWNYRNHIIAEHTLFDMDGVLCVDPTDEQNDDGPKYIDFILNAAPLAIPQKKISAIVTSRLERYREPTVEWLKKNNVRYDELIMLDLPSAAERRRLKAHAPFKAQVYKSRDEILFIESNWKQAQQIATSADKPVLCTENDLLLRGKETAEAVKGGGSASVAERALREGEARKQVKALSERLLEVDPSYVAWASTALEKQKQSKNPSITRWHAARFVQDVISSMSANLSNTASKKSKILMISMTFDVEKGAGAAASTVRLRDQLRISGHEVHTLAVEDFPDRREPAIEQPASGTKIGFWSNLHDAEHSKNIVAAVDLIKPDCIILGAVDRGIVSVLDIAKIRAPIVWVARDNWIHTGGCLFKLEPGSVVSNPEFYKDFMPALTCEGYKSGCGKCPAMKDVRESSKAKLGYDLRRAVLGYRQDIVFAPISHWMDGMLAQAPLTANHRRHVIYNPIEEPMRHERATARAQLAARLDIKEDAKIVLLAAHSLKNPRKGVGQALEALSSDNRFSNVVFLQMGKAEQSQNLPEGADIRSLGFISSAEEKELVYCAADVTLVTALQESLSVVASDSLRTGTPVVAYNTSGLSSFLEHRGTGYLAKPFDVSDLLDGLHWVLNEGDVAAISRKCLEVATDRFDPATVIPLLEAAMAEASLLYASLGEYPAELELLEGVLGTVSEDNRFRHIDRRGLVKRLDAATQSNKDKVADVHPHLAQVKSKLEWNRRKVKELTAEVERLRAENAASIGLLTASGAGNDNVIELLKSPAEIFSGSVSPRQPS